jgi:predicted Zn-dependent protease
MDFIERIARKIAPASHYWSVRGVVEQSERLVVRQDVAEAPSRQTDAGAMVSVVRDGAMGYAATSDLTEGGLKRAFDQAISVAQAAAGRSIFDYRKVVLPTGAGQYRSPNERPVAQLSLGERFALLHQV